MYEKFALIYWFNFRLQLVFVIAPDFKKVIDFIDTFYSLLNLILQCHIKLKNIYWLLASNGVNNDPKVQFLASVARFMSHHMIYTEIKSAYREAFYFLKYSQAGRSWAIRYNRVNLCTRLTNLTLKNVRYNRVSLYITNTGCFILTVLKCLIKIIWMKFFFQKRTKKATPAQTTTQRPVVSGTNNKAFDSQG